MTSPEADLAAEPVPDAAVALFGDRINLARRYAQLLCDDGVARGLIGPREAGRIWTRHLLNSAALAPFIPADASVVDLGSGAGLPGVPLVLARPDLRMTLLEPLARRMRFLELAREVLDLDVVLVRARAEEFAPDADVVVVRAVAPLARLLDLAVPLLRPGGILLAHKGSRAAAELTAAADALTRWAPAQVSVHPLQAQDSETNVVRVVTNQKPVRLGSSSRAGRRTGSRVRTEGGAR